ncbi:SDR family NAD(P)-dependent oxidoreductase [Alteromonas sp. H39]|uniref:SDR family NAD(P)-dependent oxidoreductase n=1 Tax=Alteromonas sp. H39 TaxID=3389876 RepID=UPI0039E11DD1
MSRVVVVTGSSKGLGLAIAKYFLAQGDQVFGLSRSISTLTHDRYTHSEVDVTDEKAVSAFFKGLRQATRKVDILVNNAGIASMNAFATTPYSTFQNILNVNVLGTALCCQKAFGLLKRSTAPRIINFSTVAVPLLLEGEAAYAASKSAVETFTKVLAKEYGHFKITCNAVGPSPIDTDLVRSVPKEKLEALIQKQAIKQMATDADVLNVIGFFSQPESHMITGQTIYLGGVSA